MFKPFLPFGIALCLIIATSCSSEFPNSSREEQLRRRIELAWSHFSSANLDAYVAMWSARQRPGFRESHEDWRKTVSEWKLFLEREKPTHELQDIQITGLRARAKIRASVMKKDGSRDYGFIYDYWVFENGDWFLDDADRTE